MYTRGIAAKAVAAAALSTTAVAGIGAVAMAAAGTASAAPAICAHLDQIQQDSTNIANTAFDQGDLDGAYSHLQDAIYYMNQKRKAGCR